MLEVSWFVCNSLCFFIYCYLFCNLICKEKFKINRNIIIFSILVGLLYFVLTKLNLKYYRPLIIHIYYYVCFKIIYKESYFKTLIGLLYALIISSLSEIIYGVITVLIFNMNISTFNNIWFGFTITNLCIFFISILLSKVRILKKIFANIISWYNNMISVF